MRRISRHSCSASSPTGCVPNLMRANTVASYRDTFRLLLVFASGRLEREPTLLRVEDLDAALICAFLDDLERRRGCTARTRNTRLAAVRAFFRFVVFAEPAYSLQCQQILAIPNKRHARLTVEFLTKEEAAALIAAPDRDRRLDVDLGVGAHPRCRGKGREKRALPCDATLQWRSRRGSPSGFGTGRARLSERARRPTERRRPRAPG